jgi:predicted aconitase with swiveling domain
LIVAPLRKGYREKKDRIFKVRSIVEGRTVSGPVLFSSQPIAFLQGVDPEKGIVIEPKHQIYGKPFESRVLIFPHGVGSSVGAYVIYRLKKKGRAPIAIINQRSDITTASGCAIAGIPLVDMISGTINQFERARSIIVNSKKSEIEVVDR